ncbi:MAG: hypothetical protein ACI4OL_05560 [Gemmiger sp.]
MYEFANLLLLALGAAAVFDAAAALRRRRGLSPALAWLWGQEHFLFGDGWGGAWRTRLGEAAFVLAVAAYELNVTLCNSMARENWPWLQGRLTPLLNTVVCVCVGYKVLLGTRYTWRSLAVAGSAFFIGRWVFFNSQNIWWFGMVLMVLAAKDVPLERPLKVFLAVGGATMAAVAALHFAGIVSPGLTSERVGELRGTYGYGHPNTFGGLLFGLVLAWAMLRAGRVRWGDIALIAAAGVFLMEGPGSRSAALCALGLAALFACRKLLHRRLPRLGRGAAALGAAVLPVLAAVSFVLPLGMVKIGPSFSDFSPAWLAKLNSLLTNRLSMIWVAYRMYDVKIAGQQLLDWPPLDNAYVYTVYQFGPVVAVLLGLALCWAVFRLLRVGRTGEAICLIVSLLYAFMEMQVYHFTTNPTALLLCGAVYALPAARWPAVCAEKSP